MIALVVITDGRPGLLDRTLESFRRTVSGDVALAVLVDDSEHKLGFVGAVNQGWKQAVRAGADYVFHLEDDFIFLKPVDLDKMAAVLGSNDQMSELTIRRGPVHAGENVHLVEGSTWNVVENADNLGVTLTTHNSNFTTNPSLIPREIFRREFGPTELDFGETLKAEGFYFGFLGTPSDPPMVEHIGASRHKDWRL